MSTLHDSKRRLASLRKHQRVLQAMKRVAAVNVRRLQARATAGLAYADGLEGALRAWQESEKAQTLSHPLTARRPARRRTWVLVLPDRGLSGSVSMNLLRSLKQWLAAPAAAASETHLLVAGRKAVEEVQRLNQTGLLIERLGLAAEVNTNALTARLVNDFRAGATDMVELLYAHNASPLRQEPARRVLLPLTALEHDEESVRRQWLLEPAAATVAEALLPRCLAARLAACWVDAALSEQNARLVMMDQASRNAADMMEHVQIMAHKLRHAAITRELTDIITGVEAMA